MKKILLWVLFLGFLSSCSEDIPPCENCQFTCIDEMDDEHIITNDCRENWECNFNVIPDSNVDIEEAGGVKRGDKTVFKLNSSTPGVDGIADDQVTKNLIFELDSNQKSFDAEGSLLKRMKVHYQTICFCASIDFIEVSMGCMQGEGQADGSWMVQGSLEIPDSFGSFFVKFDAHFER
ncbi:MAG: hypothetical protein AAGA77_03110 [Bacteroidota bacterium]